MITTRRWKTSMDAHSHARREARLLFERQPAVSSIEIVVLIGREAFQHEIKKRGINDKRTSY
jgi:hypothetical protein